MGVPLLPLAGAYGLGLGHLAGRHFYNYWQQRPVEPKYYTGSSGNNMSTASRTRTRMAYRKRARTRTRRRRRSFRRRVHRTAQPYSVTRVLKSVSTFDLDAGSSVLASYQMKLNSAYDPHGTAATSQGLGFDQYAALYNRYCVVGWAIKLEYVTTDNTHPLSVGFTPTTYSSALSTYTHYKECPGTVSQIVTPDIDRGRMLSRGGVKRWFLPPGGRLLAEHDLQALVSTDPAKILYGHVWAQPMQITADPATVRFVITMFQTVRFFDPVIPSRSAV